MLVAARRIYRSGVETFGGVISKGQDYAELCLGFRVQCSRVLC